MTAKIALVGYGALGIQIHEFVKALNTNADFFFLDDIFYKTKGKHAFPFSDYKNENFKDFDFHIALGYKHLQAKSQILNELIKLKRNLPSFIHSASFFNSSAKLGVGSIIYPMCNIDKDVRIGNGVLLNNSVTLSHDTVIGNCCFLSPGVVTSGNVQIGENTFIGSGTIISNNVKIGKNVQIGVGSVVTADVPDNCSAIGNPLRILDKPITIL